MPRKRYHVVPFTSKTSLFVFFFREAEAVEMPEDAVMPRMGAFSKIGTFAIALERRVCPM